MIHFYCRLSLLVIGGCIVSQNLAAQKEQALFSDVPASQTHIRFVNRLSEDSTHNVLAYEYFYNGGGVAIGDINGDGLPDIYFSGNMAPDKLYLNEGNFTFRDITKEAGVTGREGWKTGVTMADVNGDGRLDIYLCHSGKGDPGSRRNELFVNQGPGKHGIPRFKEEGHAYGLDDPGYSTQAVFFDLDNDGDLDCYVLNHNVKTFKTIEMKEQRDTRDPYAGDRLYENTPRADGTPFFTDISAKAGIAGNPIGFGLGVAVSDINGDGWEDIYVSNDYMEKDYLYINNHDNTFSDRLDDYLQHLSYFSMGSDIADYNNDGLPDIFTLDMLPEDNHRQKLLFGPENYDRYLEMVRNGFSHQFMRNMLQLNNGNNTFSEVGQLAGISNTDWSWCPLVADFDNDGWKDLYITNGYMRDYTNMDFMKYKSDYMFQRLLDKQPVDLFYLVRQMPSSLVHNYMFRNDHNLRFSDESTNWGFEKPALSSGAAYADLDGDGDLDLVVNNVNDKASAYCNETSERLKRHYLQVRLDGSGRNRFGLGAKIYIYASGNMQYFEQMPTRGFQSSVSEVIHAGLGDHAIIDSLKVVWPGGGAQTLTAVRTDRSLVLHEEDALKSAPVPGPARMPVFTDIPSPVPYTHHEYDFNDFKRQPMLPQMLSNCGPVMAAGDVNGDGREDIYAGGSKEHAGSLFIQQPDGSFRSDSALFYKDRFSTDAAAVFFDADGDKDLDLYVASGGYEDYQEEDLALQDRLYLNDGRGHFTKAINALPPMFTSKSCVKPADFNGDGYTDLFVGGRVIPGRYPEAPPSYLLQNDGKGHFRDVTASLAPVLSHAGMITDAAWLDLDGDNRPDLIIAGEFMPVTVLLNKRVFEDHTTGYFDKPCKGLWEKILVGDFNRDGRPDLIIGNLGTNSQLRASDREPLTMVFKDFDGNGSVDPVLCCYILGKSYPYASRDELLDQMYFLKKRFTSYKSYADATLQDVFTPEELAGADTLTAGRLETTYFQFDGGKFHIRPLPPEAQFSPVCVLQALDYDGDGCEDLLLFGNQQKVKLKLGRYDANYGALFRGDGKGGFTYIPQTISGLGVKGDVRSAVLLRRQQQTDLLIGLNDQPLKCYRFNKISSK